jgi:hypothetical protein
LISTDIHSAFARSGQCSLRNYSPLPRRRTGWRD